MDWGNFWRPHSVDRVTCVVRLPLLGVLVLLAIMFALWHGLKVRGNETVAAAVSQQLVWGKATTINQANYFITTAQRMATRWEFYEGLHHDELEYDAQTYINQTPGIEAIAWADASTHLRSKISSRGADSFGDPALFLSKNLPDVVEAAKLSRSPLFSKIVHVKQGIERAFLVTPLFIGDQFSGILIYVIDVDVVFGAILKVGVDEGWVYRLWDGQRETYASNTDLTSESEKWSQTISFQIPGVPLTLRAIPGPKALAMLQSNMPAVILGVGFVLIGLFLWGACAAQNAKIKSDALRDATELLQQVQEAMDSSSIVSVTDARGVITYANDNFCKISGYSPEELVGQNHRIIKSGLHPKTYYAEMWRTIAHGRIWKGEFCNRAKNGSLYWVHATIFPLLGVDGKPHAYMGVRQDITEQKRLDAELKRSNRSLEEFDHVVAHELKTPLTIIKMASENLISAGMGPLNPIQEKTIGMIDKNVDQLAATINVLLRVAKLNNAGESVEVRDIDPKRHVDRVIQNLQGVAQKRGVAVRNEVPDGGPYVRSSPEVFAEIMTNLLNNAIRYAAHEVIVESSVVPGWFHVGVRDDGPGIPKEQLSELFKKFSSDSKPQTSLFQGSGLGLYICNDLVTQMGGKIWVTSGEREGSCFYFALPTDENDNHHHQRK